MKNGKFEDYEKIFLRRQGASADSLIAMEMLINYGWSMSKAAKFCVRQQTQCQDPVAAAKKIINMKAELAKRL